MLLLNQNDEAKKQGYQIIQLAHQQDTIVHTNSDAKLFEFEPVIARHREMKRASSKFLECIFGSLAESSGSHFNTLSNQICDASALTSFREGSALWTNVVLQNIERKLLCPQGGDKP